ncbi:hypothetical protein DY000_02007489 [Brassica cretica]|uniref:Uncharacterized protein n=1 Tax=Brassica cretica TaxID=69181 RepID=A0ABQ7C6G6_BRACR|nr:hypothetical protein DY000_02007489 [Brassica cretica]
MIGPRSGITVDRHECCFIDRQSFISLTASPHKADKPLFNKTGITSATGSSDRWHLKANSKLYLVSRSAVSVDFLTTVSLDFLATVSLDFLATVSLGTATVSLGAATVPSLLFTFFY